LAQDHHFLAGKSVLQPSGCQETVGDARELLGGKAILLYHNVGRFVADAEAIYSYEGTVK
jgi:glutaryl-CoA dehydrogenase